MYIIEYDDIVHILYSCSVPVMYGLCIHNYVYNTNICIHIHLYSYSWTFCTYLCGQLGVYMYV